MIDSSIWVALLDKDDSCRDRAMIELENLENTEIEVYDHIYGEVLTVLRNKRSNYHCTGFCELLEILRVKIKLTSENIFTLANKFFFQFKKLSFTDCLLMASAKIHNAKLLTFDKNLKKAWTALSTIE